MIEMKRNEERSNPQRTTNNKIPIRLRPANLGRVDGGGTEGGEAPETGPDGVGGHARVAEGREAEESAG